MTHDKTGGIMDGWIAKKTIAKKIPYVSVFKRGARLSDTPHSQNQNGEPVMNRVMVFALVVTLALFVMSAPGCTTSSVTPVGEVSIAGNWTSPEWGAMVFSQTGSDIQGTYAFKNGSISGKLAGATLDGYWYQGSSDRRCSYQKFNSFFWGKIKLNFKPPDFTGQWGYCEDEPSPGNGWTGHRIPTAH
jgi:hypothetical protein